MVQMVCNMCESISNTRYIAKPKWSSPSNTRTPHPIWVDTSIIVGIGSIYW